ncbi:hypothetical protein LguiB_018270 [Lonicera macranthoides]
MLFDSLVVRINLHYFVSEYISSHHLYLPPHHLYLPPLHLFHREGVKMYSEVV